MEKRQRASQQHFSVDLLEFFDVNDALDVTWAHAVNSQSHLQTALSTEVIVKYICIPYKWVLYWHVSVDALQGIRGFSQV